MLWSNWKTIKKGEYLYAKIPEHPMANKNGYVLEHRVVAENKIGRLLKDNEIVHHIDGDKHNNNPENLEVMDELEHSIFHASQRKRSITKLKCANCGKEFERFANKTKRNNKNYFCSRHCNGKYYSSVPGFCGRDVKNFKYNEHGNVNSYRHGCRCEECKKANAEKARKDRMKKKK